MQIHDLAPTKRATQAHSKRDNEVEENKESQTLKFFTKDGAAWRIAALMITKLPALLIAIADLIDALTSAHHRM